MWIQVNSGINVELNIENYTSLQQKTTRNLLFVFDCKWKLIFVCLLSYSSKNIYMFMVCRMRVRE